MSALLGRRFSSVTTKVQRRREEHIKFKYPEYMGNGVTETLPRRGRRLGGTFADPSRSIGKLDGSTDSEPLLGEKKREHIKTLASTDLQAALSKSSVRKMQNPANPKFLQPFPIVREETELFTPSLESSTGLLRESKAGPSWLTQGAKFIDLYSTAIPAVFDSSLSEYRAAKSACAVFDVSYQQILTVTGADSLFVLDHFVTGPLRLMHLGDVISTCLLDGKGDVLTTATAARTGISSYELCLAGNSRESVFRYLAQFVVHSRQSGLDVHLSALDSPVIFHVHGPDRMRLLGNSLPPMSRIQTGSVTVTNLVDHAIVTGLDSVSAIPGGAYALDMLRMEAGRPRPGIDIAPGSSCVGASLVWTVDQAKVREKVLFGHARIAAELLKGPKTKRVCLVAESYVYGGCALLSAPQRFPVGRITSCAWSPEWGKRMCQAFLKTEYCVKDTPLFVNVPHAPPESLEFRFKRRIAKQGNLQTVFRKLVAATVVAPSSF